jgi:HSP20 family protein
MNTMLGSDIRQTLEHFRRSVDQVFDNFYGSTTERSAPAQNRDWTFSPVLESAWNDNHLLLRAVLPGVTQNDVKVTLNNNQLVIEGERKMPDGWSRDTWTQLVYGKFYAAVTLPTGLDVDKLNCRLHDGVLDIDIPVAEGRRPRQIRIQTGEQQKAISA